VIAGAEGAAAPAPQIEASAEAVTDSTRETTPGIGASQPPSPSLRAALQRFSAQVAQSGSPAQPKPSQPAGPDPTQSPALAALVQSIQQSPRPGATPGLGAPAAAASSARSLSSLPKGGAQPSASAEISAAVDAILNPPKAAPAAEARPIPEPPPPPPPAADPFSDAITDPRLVPSVEPIAAADAPTPPPLVEAPRKKALGAARLSVRASIAATTEDGVFLVELLKDGQSANPGAHEAFIVLTDPKADLFE
jgi:hypothetical protein